MKHTCTILSRTVDPVTGVVEVIYEFDGNIDSRAFPSLEAMRAAKSEDPLQIGTQALGILVSFWQGQTNQTTVVDIPILNRQVEIDFQAVIPNPQVKFVV